VAGVFHQTDLESQCVNAQRGMDEIPNSMAYGSIVFTANGMTG